MEYFSQNINHSEEMPVLPWQTMHLSIYVYKPGVIKQEVFV